MWDILPLVLVAILLVRSGHSRRQSARFFAGTGANWRRCYSRRSFLRLGGAAVAAGLLAHTGADEAIERWHSDRVRSAGSDRLSALLKPWGERIFFAVWAFVAMLDVTVRSSALTRWGRRNFEAMMVGLPLLWSTQRLLGGSRPSGTTHGASWRPLADNHSASGHTFMAAIPCLTAARTASGKPARWLARLASTLTGWSRLNDRMHYLSQIVLGWSIAWTAAVAVNDAEEDS